MRRAGALTLRFTLPRAGGWDLWVAGELMPEVGFSIDGRWAASVGRQLSGNSLVPDPIRVGRLTLAAGAHSLQVRRAAAKLAPGDAGAAVLDSVLLTPAAQDTAPRLETVPVPQWRRLCARSHRWVELLAR
jgi:hypothetical protein